MRNGTGGKGLVTRLVLMVCARVWPQSLIEFVVLLEGMDKPKSADYVFVLQYRSKLINTQY